MSDTMPKEVGDTPKKKFNRDEIREAVLNAKPKSKEIPLFGVVIFLKEPPTHVILDAQNQDDKKIAMATLMTQFIHTEDGEQVFDDADVEGLLAVPFNEDMRGLSNALNEMIGTAAKPDDKSKAAT